MTSRTRVLKQLVEQALYPVDDRAVAEALLAHVTVRRVLPGVELVRPEPEEAVRSFRRDARARSFRLEPRRPSAARRR